jgi:protein SCO1
MTETTSSSVTLVAALLCVGAACSRFDAVANGDSDEMREGAHPSARPFEDVVVTTQDSRQVRFYRDLVKGKTVVISIMYSKCSTVCPIQATRLASLQKLLGDGLGKKFALISITLDPVADSPERLKAWGKRFNATPGWTMVTASEDDILKIVGQLLGLTNLIKDEHTPRFLVGDDVHGTWEEIDGFVESAELFAAMQRMRNGRGVVIPAEYAAQPSEAPR